MKKSLLISSIDFRILALLIISFLTYPVLYAQTLDQLQSVQTGPSGDFFGQVVAAGNINDDDFDDLAILAPAAGQLHIFTGGSDGLSTTPVVSLTISSPNAVIQRPVVLADISGDGLDDLIVGRPDAGFGPATGSGEAWLFINSGGAPFFSPVQTTVLLPPQSLQGGRFGWSIASGDFDGNGVQDILVGEPRQDLAFIGPGRAHIFYGPVGGGFVNPDVSMTGTQSDDWFGFVVAAANVRNGNPDDAIISAPNLQVNGNTITGRVQVFSGGLGGIITANPLNITDPCLAGSEFGRLFATGDIDNNGFADLAIGSRFMGANCNSFPTSVPDVIHVFLSNGTIVDQTPATSITVPGLSGNATVTEFQITIGDFNDDNLEDLVIGVPLAFVGPSGNAGKVYLFTANSTGITVPEFQVLTESSPEDFAFFGSSVMIANIQCDNSSEILAGAPNDPFSQGEVLVFGLPCQVDCEGVPGGPTVPGTPCDDGDPCTVGEIYDINCNCLGAFMDSDGDGICDPLDNCPGFDDNVDTDGDNIPDGCDLCLGDDATGDSDGDGVCDNMDLCPMDNPDDTDGDGICDALDICPGFDDNVDTDGDNIPDGCDLCLGDDATGDSDGDGVCDNMDLCPMDNPDDTDGDGICDATDICPGFDDNIDSDGDGIPDGCDVVITLSMENVEGFSGSSVEMPVVISGCDAITSIQGSIVFDDPGIVNVEGVSPGKISPLYNDQLNTFSFYDQTASGIPLVDGDTLFSVILVLSGNPGSSTQAYPANAPLNLWISCTTGGLFGIQEIEIGMGTVQILNQVNISGSVFTCWGAGIGQATVNMTVTGSGGTNNWMSVTPTDGTYDFSGVPVGGNVNISVEKDINASNGLSTYSLYLVQQYIIGLNPPEISSPCQVIAADANCNGQVTTMDLLRIQKVIVGIHDQFMDCPSWIFIPADHVFPSPFTISNVFPYPTSTAINNLSEDETINFRGIKVGDILGAADPANLQGTLEERETLELQLEGKRFRQGEVVDLEFHSRNWQDIASLQFGLDFKPEQLQFSEYLPSSADGLTNLMLGLEHKEEGHIRLAWFDQRGKGVSFSTDEVMFKLRFIAKQDISNFQSLFSLAGEGIRAEAYTSSGERREIELSIEKNKEGEQPSLNFYCHPNPFRERSFVSFDLPEAAKVSCRVFDPFGRVVYSSEEWFQEGLNKLEIDAKDWLSGCYIYVLQSEKLKVISKMIKINVNN